MAHAVVHAEDVEARHGRFRALTDPLGVHGFRVNRLELGPYEEGMEHTHREDGQEEVYAVVGGSGTLVVDGEELAVRSGDFVYCSPDAQRKLVAGADGLIWIGIGATPEGASAG